MTIKLFKTLLVIVPCLIVTVLVILALPKEENYIYDAAGDIDAFDEPTFVTNSDMGFFYKKDQLSTYREQKKPEKIKNIVVAQKVTTTDFTKTDVTVLPDIETSYTGTHNVIMHENKVTEFELHDIEAGIYNLKGGGSVAEADAFKIILNEGILGHSSATPHRITKGNTYYAAFTEKLESIFFTFETDNEFLSVKLGELTGSVKCTLYDSSMNTIGTFLNQSKSSLEIKYKGKKNAKYYLCVTGSYEKVLTPFSINLPSDDNEWMWQMGYPKENTATNGKFDYYGDQDYYVLPPVITNEINKSVVRFTKASHDINVVVYDVNKKIIGQYVYDADKPESISMYGLDGAYAVAFYSYSGENSGAEYKFVLEHTNIDILDIETFGFELSPKFKEGTDYYTATVKTLTDKKITDVMYSPKKATVSIKVTQQCGYSKTVKLGDALPLSVGRNVVELSVTIDDITSVIDIVISDETYDLSYGYMLEKKEGIEKGAKVLVVSKDSSNAKVQICSGKNVGKIVTVPRSSIYTGYVETKVPSAYKDKINALKKAHPNWKFTFVKTGISMKDYVSSQVGASSTLDNTGKRATADEIEYYVNPLNFLDEKNIFMFEKAVYSADIKYTTSGIKAIWNDSTIASYIMAAAKSTGLSPYFITQRAALESGRGTSKLATGQVEGYKGYYNFFGIGADDIDPYNRGAAKAKLEGWTTKRKALIEGANWVDTNYISALQPTIYFMKFNPYLSWHQYMTDIKAPVKDAAGYYSAHKASGTLDSAIEFIIPVYE